MNTIDKLNLLSREEIIEITCTFASALKEIAEMQRSDASEWKILVYGAKDTAREALERLAYHE